MSTNTDPEMEKLNKVETGYAVIAVDDLYELVRKVDKLISLGWHPQGGIAVTIATEISEHEYYHHTNYYQAMVKP